MSRAGRTLIAMLVATGLGVALAADLVRAEPGHLELTRKEAILRAIRENPELGIARIDFETALYAIDQADGEFEPFGFLGSTYSKRRDPVFSVPFGGAATSSFTVTGFRPGLDTSASNAVTWRGGLRQKTTLGTAVEGRYELLRAESESSLRLRTQYDPAFTFQVSQPLLRGFGLDVNRAYVRIAGLSRAASGESFQDALLTLALNVESTYWGYALAIDNAKVAQQALKTADDALRRARIIEEAGSFTRLDVIGAEVGVAQRKEQVIRAENEVQNARDRLLRLITPPNAQRLWDAKVTLLDAPRLDDGKVDVEAAIAEALDRRPDLRAVALAIESAGVSADRAADDKLPRVDLVGTWSQIGLGPTHHSAHEALFDGTYYDVTIGLDIEHPFLNRRARAAHHEAESRRRRAMRQRDALEMTIIFEIRSAARDLSSARERVRASEVAVRLAEEQLKAEQFKLEQGVVTAFEVLQKEEDLTTARTARNGARIDFVLARSRLARARGTLLEGYGIVDVK